VLLCWWKRVWECPDELCGKRTWTERHTAIAPRAVLTERARQWAVAQVGETDATVSGTAAMLGVAWGTVWSQIERRGTPLIADPARDDPPGAPVTAVGVDETSFLRGKHPTQYATGIADLTPGRPARLLEAVECRSGPVLAGWLGDHGQAWPAAGGDRSLDPFRGYASALTAQLPDAVRVLDPFHVVKLGLTCVDEVRRRVQQEQTGHRGLRADPLFGIRRVLRRRRDRLSTKAAGRLYAGLIAGDPDGEVTLAWTAAQDP
jgi:transposase